MELTVHAFTPSNKLLLKYIITFFKNLEFLSDNELVPQILPNFDFNWILKTKNFPTCNIISSEQ